jgi:mRNA interferase YafQ
MLDIFYSVAFKKEIKRVVLQGRDIAQLFFPLAILLNDQPLPPLYRDHPLKGEWIGYREFHVESDWITIYRIEEGRLTLARTGTHSDLFKK